MLKRFEGDRFSDRLRNHGRFSLTDAEAYCRGFAFHEGASAGNGGNRAFSPHHDTPFHNEPAGSFTLTLTLLSIIRLILPDVLLPATTALGTIDPQGREQGILAGANVVMPNLSPIAVRKKYMLYDDKICTGDEAAECRVCLSNRMKRIGNELVTDRGDSIRKLEEKRICTINIH